jgi:DNA-binding transcriptional MocR family regulator
MAPIISAMNPQLSRLHPYPFERLRHLLAGVQPNPDYHPVSLGIGEPRHATPELIIDALKKHPSELATYPATAGSLEFRQACSAWLKRRYAVDVNPDTEVLPVNGSREALFAFAQTVLDGNPQSVVVSPNPFIKFTRARLFWETHAFTMPRACQTRTLPLTGTACQTRFGTTHACCLCVRPATLLVR